MKKSKLKTKARPGCMFNNVEVVDATKPLSMVVSVKNIILGVPRDYENCAGAKTAVEDYGFYKARFYRDKIYLQKTCDGPVVRYQGNKGTEMVEYLNDAKAIPSNQKEFPITLGAIRPSQRLEVMRSTKHRHYVRKKRGEAKKYPKRKATLRPRAKDAFGVRASAPRNTEW